MLSELSGEDTISLSEAPRDLLANMLLTNGMCLVEKLCTKDAVNALLFIQRFQPHDEIASNRICFSALGPDMNQMALTHQTALTHLFAEKTFRRKDLDEVLAIVESLNAHLPEIDKQWLYSLDVNHEVAEPLECGYFPQVSR